MALIVGLVGFGGIAGGAVRVAKMVFFIARAPSARVSNDKPRLKAFRRVVILGPVQGSPDTYCRLFSSGERLQSANNLLRSTRAFSFAS